MKTKARAEESLELSTSAGNSSSNIDSYEDDSQPNRRQTRQRTRPNNANRLSMPKSRAMAAEVTAEEPETVGEQAKSVQCVSTSNCGEDLVCINSQCVKPSMEGDPCRDPGRIYGETSEPLICSFINQRLRRVLTRKEAEQVIDAVVLRNVIISLERGYENIVQAFKSHGDKNYKKIVLVGMEAINKNMNEVENLSMALVSLASYPEKREKVVSSAIEAMLAMSAPEEDPKSRLNADELPGIFELVRDFKVSSEDLINMARALYHISNFKPEPTTFAMNIVLLDICHTQCTKRLDSLIAELGDDFKVVFPYVAINPRRCIEKHAMGRFSILYGEYCFDSRTCTSCESCFGMGVCRPLVAIDCTCSVREQNCADGLVCIDGTCRKRCIPGVYGCDDKMTCVGSDTDGDNPFHCIPPSETTPSTTPVPSDPATTPANTDTTTPTTTTDVYYAEDGTAATSDLDPPFVSYDTAAPPEEVTTTEPTMSAYWSIFFICLVTVMAIVITILAVKIHRLRVAFKKQRKSLMSSSPNSDGQSMLDNNVQGMDYASTNRDTFDLTPGSNPSNVRV